VGDKIKILGKPPLVVTPADGGASLKNKHGTFRASIEMLEEDKLEKLGATDTARSVYGFHTF